MDLEEPIEDIYEDEDTSEDDYNYEDTSEDEDSSNENKKIYINNIDNIIQNITDPGKYIENLLKDIISDYEISIHFIFILKYHSSYALQNNLICNNQLLLYPLTKSIITNYYNYIARQLILIPHLKKWKTIYNNKRFWTMNILDQINNLQIINSDGFINKPQTWIFHYIHNILNMNILNPID